MSDNGRHLLIYVSDPGLQENAQSLAHYAEAGDIRSEILNSSEAVLRAAQTVAGRHTILIVDAALVTSPAMLDALLFTATDSNAALVRPSTSPNWNVAARIAHKKIVSASSAAHRVNNPTHELLGYVRIGRDSASIAAIRTAQQFAASRNENLNPVDLLTVALVRTGCAVNAIPAVGVTVRASGSAEVAVANRQISEQDDHAIRVERAMRADDGFYSTFFLRKFSRKLSLVAIDKGWTPNQITLASLAMAFVTALLFATGWHAALIVGAVLAQVSLIVDCSDGEVARYTGRSSRIGAWLDASTDRVKEYAMYAGLAFGAARNGQDLWKLALGLLLIQTVRHTTDYNFAAIQAIRESSVSIIPMSQSVDETTTISKPILVQSAALNSRTALRWVKKIIHFPIGERWLVISLGALFGSAELVFDGLLFFGVLGLVYTTVGRYLRTKTWRDVVGHSGSDILERQLDMGPLSKWVLDDSANPLAHRFGWVMPSFLRFLEFGIVWLVAANNPWAFLWLMVIAFHHYDAMYRSLGGYSMQPWINTWGLGWDGRTLLVIICSLGFVITLNTLFILGGLLLAILFVVIASRQWYLQIR